MEPSQSPKTHWLPIAVVYGLFAFGMFLTWRRSPHQGCRSEFP